MEANAQFSSKMIYLSKGTILWRQVHEGVDIYEAGESEIHGACFEYLSDLSFNFRRAVAAANPNALFRAPTGNTKLYGNATFIQPDFSMKLDGRVNGFLVGEFVYSLPLVDGHQRAQELLALEDVHAAIVISIRYPWNVTIDGGVYDEEDGNITFLYYTRNGPRDPVAQEIIPDRIITFGNTGISANEIDTIHRVTHFPVNLIEGVGLDCNQATRDLPAFMHEVSSRVLLVVNEGDVVTMTNHSINDVPHQQRFVIHLADLKQAIRRGVVDLNRLLATGRHQIPNINGYRF